MTASGWLIVLLTLVVLFGSHVFTKLADHVEAIDLEKQRRRPVPDPARIAELERELGM
jgi:hypothetical protein